MKTNLTTIALLAALLLLLALSNLPEPVKAQVNSATINQDGTITPQDAPIQQNGSTYYLNSNMNLIINEANNITLDGQGHTFTEISCERAANVTIKNLITDGGEVGIDLYYCSNCTITNCNITNSYVPLPPVQATAGIYIVGGGDHQIFANNFTNNINSISIGLSSGNVIFENNITGSSQYGTYLYGVQIGSSNNTIYNNNIIKGKQAEGWYLTIHSENSWDFNGEGNFWSNYNGTDANGDSIGDTPHYIFQNNTDYYPLMQPYHSPQPTPTPSPTPSPPPTPTSTPAMTPSPTQIPTPTQQAPQPPQQRPPHPPQQQQPPHNP
jgi:parallel beta-helix repeat protein